GGFLHDITQLPRQDELAATRHARRLDEEDVPADGRPRETRGNARHGGPLRDFVLEARGSQHLGHIARLEPDALDLAFRDAHGSSAQERTDLTLETAAAGFAGVLADEPRERRVGEARLFGLESIGLELAGDEVAFGDLELLFLRVAGELDDLHPIAQRAGDGVEDVGGGDEEHVAQVERQGEIVVAEGRVLLGIEHFEQCRSRIALEARAELVDLIEHEHGVAGARLAQTLDDVARESPDIRAAVAADLRLIVHAAQTRAHELEAERPRDTLTE